MPMAGLLLAAGASRRLGVPKQLVTGADGVPLVARAAQQLVDAGCAPVLVVLGAEAEAVGAAVAMLPVQCVVNAEWARGMGASIAAGVDALAASLRSGDARHVVDAVLITACDMPAVTVAHLTSLMACGAHGARVASAYTRADGETVRGIPAVLPREDWPWLQMLSGDVGARELLRRPETRTVFLDDGAFDLDTAADLDRWRGGGVPSPHSPHVSSPD